MSKKSAVTKVMASVSKSAAEDDEEEHGGVPQSSTSEALLSELMSALATGARAVQGLPLGDDFDYQSSFPEFRGLLEDTQDDLLQTLLLTLEETTRAAAAGTTDKSLAGDHADAAFDTGSFESLDDPLLWEACTDLCDALLEEAEAAEAAAAQKGGTGGGPAVAGFTSSLQAARDSAHKSFGRLLNGIVDMKKPQDVYGFGPLAAAASSDATRKGAAGDHDEIVPAHTNEREAVFVPPFIHQKYYAKEPLDLETLEPGHGIDTKFGDLRARNASLASSSDNALVAPTHHLPHVYRAELRALQQTDNNDNDDPTTSEHSYPPWALEAPSTPPPKTFPQTPSKDILDHAVWVDTPQSLAELVQQLQGPDNKGPPPVKEVAIDLEAHSYRSFAGMICLIQISFEVPDGNGGEDVVQRKDFLIDPFPLWDKIHDALAPTLANPKVVKIFHGADSDVAWLQRDFGLYVVNMFDTGRAARALQLSSFGFAHLLERYVDGIQKADKTHQLSDWRQRPLPASMKEYAILDTHYLLRIYRALKYELSQSKKASIEEVMEESRKVCTIRYAQEGFRPDGYKSIMSTQRKGRGRKQLKSRTKTELTARQETVLKDLWDWRDQVARNCDESHAYVCGNTALLRLAMACPSNLSTMQSLLQPMPPIILRNFKDILAIVQASKAPKQEKLSSTGKGGPPSSAFFRPASAAAGSVGASSDPPDLDDVPEDMDVDGGGNDRRPSPRSLMSPVLGTEALYRQAGWISPHQSLLEDGRRSQNSQGGADDEIEDIVTTTTEDDADDEKDDDDEVDASENLQGRSISIKKKNGKRNKPRRGLVVHESNREFQSKKYTDHSLQLGETTANTGEGIKSCNTQRGKQEVIDGLGPARATHEKAEDIDKAVADAQSSAAQIRITLESRGIIGMIPVGAAKLTKEGGETDETGQSTDCKEDEEKTFSEEEFRIPRSVREIYRISNRNRAKKKAPSPLPPELSEEELKELAEAEAVLQARAAKGNNYLDIVAGSPKRQRTKSTGGASLSSSDEAGGQDSGNITRDDDIAFMKEIGWIESKDELEGMLKASRRESDPEGEDELSFGAGGGGGRKSLRETPTPTGSVGRTPTPTSRSSPRKTPTPTRGETPTKPFDYSNVGSIGAFAPTTAAVTASGATNPFFAGAALQGGHLNNQQQQQFGTRPEKKKPPAGSGSRGGKSRRQTERPEKRDNRSQAYKKR